MPRAREGGGVRPRGQGGLFPADGEGTGSMARRWARRVRECECRPRPCGACGRRSLCEGCGLLASGHDGRSAASQSGIRCGQGGRLYQADARPPAVPREGAPPPSAKTDGSAGVPGACESGERGERVPPPACLRRRTGVPSRRSLCACVAARSGEGSVLSLSRKLLAVASSFTVPGRGRWRRRNTCPAATPGAGGPCRASRSYLVDPASSHMLVSKIKPCMSKYKQLCTVKLRMAH